MPGTWLHHNPPVQLQLTSTKDYQLYVCMTIIAGSLRHVMQVENVKKGFPYIMFGDGYLASCKPISEADLASFMADCIEDKGKVNQVLPIGGKMLQEVASAMSAADFSRLTRATCLPHGSPSFLHTCFSNRVMTASV